MIETRKQLPQFVRDLLASPPAVGEGMNAWLFRVARVMHPYRENEEIVATLAASVAGQPVAMLDIERAVKNSKDAAWSPDAMAAPRPKTWPAVNLEQREAITTAGGGLADLWEASPVKWEDSENHAEQIIDALLPDNPLLCVGKSIREFATRSRSKWQGRLSEMQLIVPSPMTSRKGITKEGRESEHTLSNTGSRQFLVIEQDQGTPDEQAAILLNLSKAGPLVLAVHSGSKSLHGWFACLGISDEKLRAFMSHAVTLGADPATWTKSQFVRMPDGTRDNGNRQSVFYFNPFLLPTTGGRTNKNERNSLENLVRSLPTKPANMEAQAEIKRDDYGNAADFDMKTKETITAYLPKKAREPRIRFFKPSQLRDYEPDNGAVLFGENHICRGEVFVIGGEPGVGKSTAATELAICGATGRDWLGLKTHGTFKTLIIQNENGRYRLQQEYAARGLGLEIEESILVSEPPPYGMTLNHPEFLEDVKTALDSFMPDVVIFDPWNAAARDDKAADYQTAFDALRNMLPKGKDKPALGIVAHTKKPQANEKRTGGSGLMHLLAGSYVLTSVPRAIFIMVRGGNDETDNSVVWFNPKNSNGPAAPRTAWEREPKGFTLLSDFDWNAFEGGDGGRKVIRLEHIQAVLGRDSWDRTAAIGKLEKESDCGKRACQKALSEKSPFASHLEFDGKWVKFKADEDLEQTNE